MLGTVSEDLSGADIETIGLTARRHALFDAREPDLGAVVSAIFQTQNGRAAQPQRKPLDPEQKRQLAVTMKESYNLSGADIARLLGVSRQAIYGYLKQPDGEPHHG